MLLLLAPLVLLMSLAGLLGKLGDALYELGQWLESKGDEMMKGS